MFRIFDTVKRNILLVVIVCLLSAGISFGSIWVYHTLAEDNKSDFSLSKSENLPVNYANYIKDIGNGAQPVDFSFAAKISVDAVVHIKTKTKAKMVDQSPRNRRSAPSSPFDDFFDDFFGFGPPLQRQREVPEMRASGSGVIVTEDGYIVTNNHVVEGADEIKVTLSNKKSYIARLVGRDANSDLAVIKIDAKKLPLLVYGNSEEVQIGQWVLAIGYPLFLDVTVTAGIVSAKSRSIGINAQNTRSNLAVEAFIQTDAAVNRGNSGGALVNTRGELVGINSAIASPTGYYSGYSYAIPANMVKKVVEDIIKYGSVQRAFLGISYPSSDDELPESLAKKYPDYKVGEGILVIDVATDGAAKVAGIKVGDIVTKINDIAVTKGAELVEQISKYHPGDKITVTYSRNHKENTVKVTLLSKSGTYASLKFAKLGCEFGTLSKKEANEYRVKGGVVVKKIGDGIINKQTRIRPGFIITKVENKEVHSVEQLQDVLMGLENRIQIEGFYPNYDGRFFYEVDLSADSTELSK